MDGSAGSTLPQAFDFAAVRRQALAVVGGQLAVALFAAALCLVLWGRQSAVSALVGGAIGAAASLAQVWVGLRNASRRSPRQVMQSFLRGSAMKLAVTVVLFVLALRGRRLLPAPLFVTYVVTFLVYWLALARLISPRLSAAVAAENRD